MGTMVFQGVQPIPGGDIDAEPLTDTFTNVINTYNGPNATEANADTTSATGLMGLSTAQTVTGQKTFNNIRIRNALSGLQVRVYNNSGGALAAGDYLYISGYNSGQDLYEVTKAQAKIAANTSLYADLIADEAISNASAGNAILKRILTGQNTSGLTVGRPVWLSKTAAGWSGTPHTDGAGTQIVGKVLVENATTGRILQFVGPIIPWMYAGGDDGI